MTLSHHDEYLTPSAGFCPRVRELFRDGGRAWKAAPDGDGFEVARRLELMVPDEALKARKHEYDFIGIRDVLIAMKGEKLELPFSFGDEPELVARIDRLGALQVEKLLRGASWKADLEMARCGLGTWLGE